MPLTTTEENAVADFEKARLLYLSLHTADPGSSGANETSGGGYSRQSLASAWGSSSAGSASTTQQSFTVAAGTYTHFGFWSSSSAGTFLGGNALASQQVLAGAGIVKVTATLNVTVS